MSKQELPPPYAYPRQVADALETYVVEGSDPPTQYVAVEVRTTLRWSQSGGYIVLERWKGVDRDVANLTIVRDDVSGHKMVDPSVYAYTRSRDYPLDASSPPTWVYTSVTRNRRFAHFAHALVENHNNVKSFRVANGVVGNIVYDESVVSPRDAVPVVSLRVCDDDPECDFDIDGPPASGDRSREIEFAWRLYDTYVRIGSTLPDLMVERMPWFVGFEWRRDKGRLRFSVWPLYEYRDDIRIVADCRTRLQTVETPADDPCLNITDISQFGVSGGHAIGVVRKTEAPS